MFSQLKTIMIMKKNTMLIVNKKILVNIIIILFIEIVIASLTLLNSIHFISIYFDILKTAPLEVHNILIFRLVIFVLITISHIILTSLSIIFSLKYYKNRLK